MKLKNLIENSNIPAVLIRAVVAQMGGKESFEESAPDVASHGIDGGFGNFVYHSDTVPFAEKHRGLIAEMAEDQADEFGTGVLEMVQGFGCLTDRRENPPKPDYTTGEIARCLYGTGDDAQIMNALAWYAGEEVCRLYTDLLEQEAA